MKRRDGNGDNLSLGRLKRVGLAWSHEMSKDSQMQQAVIAELGWEPSVTAGHIGVAAHAGVVTLTGHVVSYVEKEAAEHAAQRVKGVKAIAQEIKVQLPLHVKKSDEEIAAAVVNRLAWDTSVPADAIKVEVDGGWVTLSGEVDWHYQKMAAEQDVGRLMGVVGLSNRTTIRPRVNVANVSDDITHALNRSWFFNPDNIFVSADQGRIHLTGTVDSWHDRQVAAATAWAAPGATSVVNDISIN